MNKFKKMVEIELNPPIPKNNTIYRVVIGSYADKANANEMVKEAKEKGFEDAFIVAK
jgi:cell division protein FtsN